MEKIERAVIVAAGEGRRMRPVTETIPKPLVSVNGTRIIDTSIQALKANGIHEIYIVAGYKKECFYEAFQDDPDITVIENTQYLEGNNITSLYAAREHLQRAFVIEGDVIVKNADVFSPEISRSMYCCQPLPFVPEWAVKEIGGRLVLCDIKGNVENAYRLWGISMWTAADGEKLAEAIREQVEERRDLSVYWDEIPLTGYADQFVLGIREIREADLMEIDTVRELAELDHSYEPYCRL